MEFTKFFNLVRKHKYGLIAIPVLVMVITFFLVRKLPDVYASHSRLSAGLTAGSQSMQLAQQLLNGADNMADSKINQTFSNVTQTMQLKIVFDQVSYQLILHDLTSDKPFRKPSKLFHDLNPNARKHAIEVYNKMYADRQSLYLTDPDQNGLNEVLVSMKYDYESLKDKVKIYRVENSDFIDVNYESDNPLLSEFVVNTLCREFITYYSALNQQNKLKSVDFIYAEMMKKKDSLDAKTEKLKNYKIQNQVLDISDETKSLYAQIADFETRLQLAEKEVDANTSAIMNIDSRFDVNEKQYMENTLSSVNKEIIATQEQLNQLNDQYIKSRFDQSVKDRIDSMKIILSKKINQSTDRHIVSPLTSKESLIAQKLKLEMDLQLAKGSIQSYRDAISRLNSKLQSIAPNEADIQSYEADIAVLSKEYLELQNRYNQSSMQLNSTVPIKVIEPALPGNKLPSKKLVLVILGGVVSFVIYLLILFVLFYLDDSIQDSNDLANKTDTRVLGELPVIKSSFVDMQKLWNIDAINPPGNSTQKFIGSTRTDVQRISGESPKNQEDANFKKLIRATRFEINMALRGGRNLVVTSLAAQEGKTLITLNMVSAFQMMNKKVLLIDGNFLNPGITMMMQPKYFVEDYLAGETALGKLVEEGNVTVLGNMGRDISLFEINSESNIVQKLLELKEIFDIVLIETSALDTLNQAKEWIAVADKVVGVFEANASISDEMKEHIHYLKGMEGKFMGWILNKTTK
jgi:succinoglycan biosynthesis transport protein ExoP